MIDAKRVGMATTESAGNSGSMAGAVSAEMPAIPVPVPQETLRIVLPAYNEGETLPPLLRAIAETMRNSRLPYEVIVVDDGSGDQTADVAEQAANDMPLALIRHPQNRGLAATLETGLRAALDRGGPHDIILTMDADNTHPAELMLRMIDRIHGGDDVVVASRYQPGARVVGVPWTRHVLSFGARCLFSVVFPIPGIRDFTCGYRAYRADVIRQAFREHGDNFISENGFSCMVDVLLKLRKYPLTMSEVPITLRYDHKVGASKMRVARTVLDTLKLVVKRRIG